MPPEIHANSNLRALVALYEAPTAYKSIIQLVTSIGLFLAACVGMYWSLGVSYWLTLLLAIPTAGLLVRVFIVQHDCGHGSFFRSRRANDIVGSICSVMTLTPYANWRRQHNCHHSTWNNLDRRESGADIYSACLTVAEYRALSAWRRFAYRLIRHPLVAQLILPPLVFLFLYRIPFDTPKSWSRERRSVHRTNLAILGVFGGLALWLGIGPVLLIEMPVITLTAIAGVCLFSLQHRFEDTLWTRQPAWTATNASLQGSSYLKLPRVLQWFSGNIGFHHVHHLSPRVPNYQLEACHNAIPDLSVVKALHWRDGFSAIGLSLWDEVNHRMVRFRDARPQVAAAKGGSSASRS